MKWILPIALLILSSCSHQTTEIPPKPVTQVTITKIPEMMQAYGVDGMVVSLVKDNQVLLSKGYGTNKDGESFTADTPCSIYSATKAISSITLASMLEDQVFDINKPLSDYLDDIPEAWQNIPFWRLLNHTSGITMIVNKPEFGSIAENPKAGNRDIYNYVKAIPMDYQPGEYSRYRQSGYAIAEMIYANKLGMQWHDLVIEHLTKPAGTTLTFNPELNSGKRITPLLTSAGGFQTTANDMVKIFSALNADKIVSRDGLQNLLYKPMYNFNDYSLGSIRITVDGQATVGHQGGGRANIRYAPQSGVGVFVCTDDRSNKAIMVDLANMLMQEVLSGKPALVPIQLKLYALKDQSAKTVIATYNNVKNSPDSEYEFSRAENVLNGIGYSYLADDKKNDAIEIFKFMTNEFPDSVNAYDSLGEAYRSAGRIDDAIKSYETVLTLMPESASAKNALEEMRANGQ